VEEVGLGYVYDSRTCGSVGGCREGASGVSMIISANCLSN
jgi:hypothetical protein